MEYNLGEEIFKFMITYKIFYEEACCLFDISEEDFDILLTQKKAEKTQKGKNVKKILDYFYSSKRDDKILEEKFDIAVCNSSKAFKNLLNKKD